MNNPHEIELLRPDQLAKAIGVTTDTIYKWVGQGMVPHYRLGRCIHFRIEDVQQFLAQRRIEHDR